jgi:chaperone required for assembly of F1-ATPase
MPAPAAPANLPAVRSATPTERALGNVLVEGALLTEQKLDALRGIQQMLASVDMNFKLGELAVLFKFLSPDQLLAALLVSRGYVSPQQIAGLGRVKQELAASGMDYDLETLLGMFHILPPDQLRQIRAELH